MEDREFFDKFYALWASTSGAGGRYWRPEPDGDLFTVVAVGDDDSVVVVASGLSEVDADWLCGIHGAFPDVVRRLHQALDEADRLDRDVDDAQVRLAQLELELGRE